MHANAVRLLGSREIASWFLVGSRGPGSYARPDSDWDYIVVLAREQPELPAFEYLRDGVVDVGVYQPSRMRALLDEHVPWALMLVHFPPPFAGGDRRLAAPTLCHPILELALYSELSTDWGKAQLFWREGDGAHAVKKLLHHLRMCSYALQLVECGSIQHWDPLDAERAALNAGSDPLAAFEALNEHWRQRITRAMEASLRQAEQVPLESTPALEYLTVHGRDMLQRHFPLYIGASDGLVRHRVTLVSTRWAPSSLAFVRAVVGARVQGGVVVQPPTPTALLGATDRARLALLWPRPASAVARRVPRWDGATLCVVSRTSGGEWMAHSDVEPVIGPPSDYRDVQRIYKSCHHCGPTGRRAASDAKLLHHRWVSSDHLHHHSQHVCSDCGAVLAAGRDSRDASVAAALASVECSCAGAIVMRLVQEQTRDGSTGWTRWFLVHHRNRVLEVCRVGHCSDAWIADSDARGELVQGWLCYDEANRLLGLEPSAPFECVWELRRLSEAKTVSADKARSLLVALWCCDEEQSVREPMVPPAFQPLMRDTYAALAGFCGHLRDDMELRLRVQHAHARELSAAIGKVRWKSVLFAMHADPALSAASALRQARPASVEQWLDRWAAQR